MWIFPWGLRECVLRIAYCVLRIAYCVLRRQLYLQVNIIKLRNSTPEYQRSEHAAVSSASCVCSRVDPHLGVLTPRLT
jgi:hypothetical protein